MKKNATLATLILLLFTMQAGALPLRLGKRHLKELTKETVNEKKRISEAEWQNNCKKAIEEQNSRFKTTPYPFSTLAEPVPMWVEERVTTYLGTTRYTFENTYDEEGLKSKKVEIKEEYQGNNTYIKNQKQTYQYNKQGNINAVSIEYFSDNQWFLSSNEKRVYEERNDSLIIFMTRYSPTGEAAYKEINYYNKKKEQVGYESYSMYNNAWQGTFRWYALTEPQINNIGEQQGTVTTRTEQSFQNNRWIDERISVTYSNDGYKQGYLNKYWNNENNQWDIHGNIRTVKINNQKLPIEEISQTIYNNTYTTDHHSWKEYDSRNNLTLTIDSTGYQYAKEENTYLSGTNLRTTNKRSVMADGQWKLEEESTYAYEQGRLIEEINSDYYNDKIRRYKETYAYNQTTGLPTEYAEYDWLNTQNRYMLVYRTYDFILQPCTAQHTESNNPYSNGSFECPNEGLHIDETMIGVSRMEQAIEETDESEDYTGNEKLETFRYTATLDNAGRLIEEKSELIPSGSHTKSFITTITYNEKGLRESKTEIEYVDGIIKSGEKYSPIYDSANKECGTERLEYSTETSSWELQSRYVNNMNMYNPDGTLASTISESRSPRHWNGQKYTYQYLTESTGQKIVSSYFVVGDLFTDWTELERLEHQLDANGNTKWQQRYAIDNNGQLVISTPETDNNYLQLTPELFCNNRPANTREYPLGWKTEASFIQVMRDPESLEQPTTQPLLRSNDATITGEVTITDAAVKAWQLFDTNGNLVASGSGYSVHLGHLPSGIYLLSARTNDSIRVAKIVR